MGLGPCCFGFLLSLHVQDHALFVPVGATQKVNVAHMGTDLAC